MAHRFGAESVLLVDHELSSSEGWNLLVEPLCSKEECREAFEEAVSGGGDCIRAYRLDVDPGEKPVMQWLQGTSLRRIISDLRQIGFCISNSSPLFSIREMIARGSITE